MSPIVPCSAARGGSLPLRRTGAPTAERAARTTVAKDLRAAIGVTGGRSPLVIEHSEVEHHHV